MPHHGSIFDSPAPCIRYFITKPTQNLYPHLLPRWSSFEVSLSSAHPNPTITTDTAVLSRIASPTPSTSTSPSLHSFPLQLPSSKLGENEGGGDLGDLHQKSGNLRGKVAHLSWLSTAQQFGALEHAPMFHMTTDTWCACMFLQARAEVTCAAHVEMTSYATHRLLQWRISTRLT